MRLTKKKAIEISIELWTWLAETGEHKMNWSGWEKYGEMVSWCALCKLGEQKSPECACDSCPYFKVFGECDSGGLPYNNWCHARTKRGRKKFASQFLEQLTQL